MSKIFFILTLSLQSIFLCVVVGEISTSWWPSGELSVLQKMFDDCAKNSNDPAYCLKNKAATAIERALSRNISITDDLVLVRNNVPESRNFKAHDLDPDQRIVQALQNLMSTHTFKVDLTDDTDNVGESRDGGSGGGHHDHHKKKQKKVKKVLPYILLMKLTAMSIFGPIAIKTLTLIAGKALIASKIALVISGMILLKKVFQSDSHHHESATFQVHTVPEHHHGRDLKSSSMPIDNHIDPYRSYNRLSQ